MAILEVVAHLRANADDMVSGFRRAQNAASSFNGEVAKSSAVAQRGFGLMKVAAIGGFGAMQTAAMMGAKKGIQFAMANEQAIISFKTLLGTQSKAEDMFKSLQTFAASTPFEFPQLRDAASKLLTTGVAADRVIPIMTALGDSTAAMGTGAEGIQRAVYALQQMNLVGAVKGQDMMQLANAGIPAWDVLANAAKMSVSEVKKAVEKGTLKDSVPLLMSGIEKYSGAAMGRMKGMMAEQSQTLTGLMSTLKDNINIALGDMMKPATGAIKDALPAINDAIGATMKSMTKPIGDMVTMAMEQFKKLIPSILPIMMALSQVMVSVIGAIVPVFVSMASIIPSVTPALTSLGKVLGDLGAILGPLVSELVVAFVPILMSATTVVSVLTGFLAAHKGILQALIPVIGGVVAGYVAWKAVNMVQALWKTVSGTTALILETLGLGTAHAVEATAATAAMVSQQALAVAQAEAMVAAGGGAAAAAALTAAETALAAATGAAEASTWGLTAAMIANPIGLIIAGVVALVAAFVILWMKVNGFRNFWKYVWNGIVQGVQWSINIILGIFNFLANRVIDVANIMIAAWNKIPWHKDVKPLSQVNYQLNVMGAQVDTNVDKANKLSAALQHSAGAFRKFEEASKAVWASEADSKASLAKVGHRGNPLGSGPAAAAAAAAAAAGTGGAGKAADKLKQLVTSAKQLGSSALSKAQGFFDNIKQRADDFAKSIKDAIMNVYSFSDAFTKATQTQTDYTTAAQALADAEAKVADALATRDLKAYNDALIEYGKAQTAAAAADKGRMTFLQALEAQYNQAQDFTVLINRLRAANLNEAGISQIIAAGADTGAKIANELLNGGADAINKANTWYTALSSTASDAAAAAREDYYGAGLTTGQALVNGIKDAVKGFTLKLSSKGITAAQIDKLKKQFGVDIEFGMTSLESLAKPMATGGIVKARSGGMLALLGEAGRDEAVIPLNRGGGSNAMGGNTYAITVQAGVGDPAEIGRQVVKALQAYEKRAGRLPIRTA
jgi:tape measure domain-containing protein